MPGAVPLKRARPAKPPAPVAARPPQLQAKLEVGPTGDHFEHEADSVAREVMRGGSAPVTIPPTITPMGAQRKTIEAEKKPEEEKKAQRKPAGPLPMEDEKKVQRKEAGPVPVEEELKSGPGKQAQRDAAAGAAGGEAGSSVESSIARMQSGSASGLDSGTRGFMEGRFGRDFGGVRIHSGSDAASAAQAINARAFTVGRDVFFNSGQYAPHSPAGRELIAHELTHTVQQAGSAGHVGRKIQRVKAAAAPKLKKSFNHVSTALPGAEIQEQKTPQTDGIFTLPMLELPTVQGMLKGTKGGIAEPAAAPGRDLPIQGKEFVLKPVPKRKGNAGKAFKIWTSFYAGNKATTDAVKNKLNAMIKEMDSKADPSMIYYFTFKETAGGARDFVFAGKTADLAKSDEMLRPQWHRNGRPHIGKLGLAADHILEYQLGGKDAADNMWLLQSDYNSAIGPAIEGRIASNINKVLAEISDKPAGLALKDADAVKPRWTLKFLTVAEGSDFPDSSKAAYWTPDEIKRADHIEHLKVMTTTDLGQVGLKLDDPGKTRVKIFPSATGGRIATIPFDKNGTVEAGDGLFLFKNVWVMGGQIEMDEKKKKADEFMTLKIRIDQRSTKKNKQGKKPVIGRKEKDGLIVKRMPAFENAGYITRESLTKSFSDLDFTPLCPIKLSEVWINPDGELVCKGTIHSEHALLPKLKIPFSWIGDEITVDFPVPAANVKLGPISIVDSTISLGVSDDDFFLRGRAGIKVKGLGHGEIVAETKDGNAPTITGGFDLDIKFLESAHIGVTYDFETETMAASAKLSVKKGVLPGVEAGTIDVAVTEQDITAIGTVDLGAPLEGTQLGVKYGKTSGLVISASNIPLPFARIPGVKEAKMSVSVSRKPGAKDWSVNGSGKAQFAIANVTGGLTVTYEDGLFVIKGHGIVKRDPAVGFLDFTAANAPVDDKGNPIRNQLGARISVWGKGGVSVTFGKIVAAAAIEYTPDGRVLIDGRIALASNYQLFAKKAYHKDIFSFRLPEFPIWGVSFHGIGIGIMGFADIKVSAEASVGPGELRNAAIDAKMDIAKPEEATLHGQAEFFVPGYAGLIVDVGGGLVARLANAYAEGRIGIEGHLGLAASVGARLDVNWSKATGMELGTKITVDASPKLGLYANASLTVGVNLLVADPKKTFGPWRAKLGEIGPNMTLGAELPIKWSEAKGLDLGIDQIVIKKPNLDAKSLMSDTFAGLAGPAS